MRTRRPINNHASAGLQILGCNYLPWLLGFRHGAATLVMYRLWAHRFQTDSGGPGPAGCYLARP